MATAQSGTQVVHFDHTGVANALQHQLRHAITPLQLQRLAPVVEQHHTNVSTEVRVDNARSNRNVSAPCQFQTRRNSAVGARGQGQGEVRKDDPFPKGRDGLVSGARQVVSSGTCCAANREDSIR